MASRIYSPELAREIIRRLADGETLTAICKSEGLPGHSLIVAWARGEYPPFPEFPAEYAVARETGWERMAEELLDLSDDGTRDMRIVDGEEVVDHDHIARARLRADTRKWLLSKRLPKKFGDKLELEHKGGTTTRVISGEPLNAKDWAEKYESAE